MNIGSLFVWIAVLMGGVATVSAIRWARGNAGAEWVFRGAYHGMTASLFLAAATLMRSILVHDFRFDYVIGYSSRDLPLLYLISSFWAGQEGTFLLWALMAAGMGYFLFRKKSWEPATVMSFYLPSVGFLLLLMLDPGGNPFRLAGRVPPDGNGLNPLLQDPWMASHPPAVFLGYVAMAGPAALALAAVFKKKTEDWLKPALRWSLMAFVLLGIGIVLGGFWAYKVLGWGGYWGWDPVENSSLFPWIAVVALLHGILVQKATGALRRTNLVLALMGYLTVVYATFLTRSGVLADFSVHSFPAGTIYRQLVAIMLVVAAVSAFAIFRARRPGGTSVPMSLGWPLVLSAVVLFLALSGAVIMVATSWPILSGLFGRPSSIAISFYNEINLPIFTVLLALLSFAPFLSWSPRPRQFWWKRMVGPGVVAAICAAIAMQQGAGISMFLILFFVAVFALASNVTRLVEVARTRLLRTGAAMAHAGFALMFVGVVASSAWTVTEDQYLPLDQPVEAMGEMLTFRGHVGGSEPEHRWRIGIRQPGGEEKLKEVTLFSAKNAQGETGYTRKPAILRRWTRDLYMVPAAVEGGGKEHRMELLKEQPQDLHGATLTFLSFELGGGEDSMTVLAVVQVQQDGTEETVTLPMLAGDNGMQGEAVPVQSLPGTTLELAGMAVEKGLIRVIAREGGGPAGPTLVVQASTKPLMGAMWVGTLLLGFGCVVATVRRYVDLRTHVPAPAPSRKAVAVPRTKRARSRRRPAVAVQHK